MLQSASETWQLSLVLLQECPRYDLTRIRLLIALP